MVPSDLNWRAPVRGAMARIVTTIETYAWIPRRSRRPEFDRDPEEAE